MLEDLGQFVVSKIEETGADVMTALLKDLAVCIVNPIAGVISVVTGRDSSKDAAADMPPVLLGIVVNGHNLEGMPSHTCD